MAAAREELTEMIVSLLLSQKSPSYGQLRQLIWRKYNKSLESEQNTERNPLIP